MFFTNRKDDLTREIDEYYNTHNFEHSTHSMEKEIAEAEGREYVNHSKHSMKTEILESESKKRDSRTRKQDNFGTNKTETYNSTANAFDYRSAAQRKIRIITITIAILIGLIAATTILIANMRMYRGDKITEEASRTTYYYLDEYWDEFEEAEKEGYDLRPSKEFMNFYALNNSMHRIESNISDNSYVLLSKGSNRGTEVILLIDAYSEDDAQNIEDAIDKLANYMWEHGADYDVYFGVTYYPPKGDSIETWFDLGKDEDGEIYGYIDGVVKDTILNGYKN